MTKSGLASVGIALAITASICCIPRIIASAAHASTSNHRAAANETNLDWPVYGGEPANDHFSTLTQINSKNVSKLRVAWTFDTRETGGMQCSPLIVGRVLY